MRSGRLITLVATVFLAVLATSSSAEERGREQVSLDGTWQFKPLLVAKKRIGKEWVDRRELPWTEVRVPSMWREGLRTPSVGLPEEWVDCRKALYRRTFFVPSRWRGRRVLLKFDAVASLAEVRINGQQAGAHLGGWVPFELDITPFVKFGRENELEVKVSDFTCALEGDFKVEGNLENSLPAESLLPEGSLLSPEPLFAGIWGSVTLEARPLVYIEEVYIFPKGREGKVEASLGVVNGLNQDIALEVACRIFDRGQEAGRFESYAVTLKAKERVTLSLRGRVEPIKRWELSRPRLLTAEVSLLDPEGGKAFDRLLLPFGYRQFSTLGPKVLLDGEHIFLRGAEVSLFDLPFESEPELREALKALKATLGLNSLFLSGGVHPKRVAQVADRAGFLLFEGFMLSGKHLAWWREEFLKNVLKQVEGWVKRGRNHPSVVAWVIEQGGLELEGEEHVLFEVAELIRRLDPTRPIIFWEDLCGLPGEPDWKEQIERGPGDVISIRLELPPLSPLMPVRDLISKWEGVRRGKPLLVSKPFQALTQREEMLASFGGLALRNPLACFEEAVQCLSEGFEALKSGGVSGVFLGDLWKVALKRRPKKEEIDLAPRSLKWRWLPGLTSVGEALASLLLNEAAAAWLEGRRVYKAGEEFLAEFTLIADERAPRRGRVQFSWWCLLPGGAIWEAGCEVFPPFKPFSPRTVRIKFGLPRRVKNQEKLLLRTELWVGGREVVRREYAFWLVPHDFDVSAPLVEQIHVLDPKGKVAALLERINPRMVESLSTPFELPEETQRLIVVGDVPEEGEEILQVVERGGTVVFIEPSHLPDWLPLQIESGMSKGRLIAPGHPLLDGLGEELLRHWGGVWRAPSDCYIVRDGRPMARRDIVVSGTKADPSGFSLLTEVRISKGRIIVCCLRLTELIGSDPVARRLFWDMVRYMQRVFPGPVRVAVAWEPGEGAMEKFDQLGLDVEELSSPEVLTREAYDLFIVGSGGDWETLPEWRDRMREFVEEGGTVLVFLPREPFLADGFLPWPLKSEEVEAEGALKADPKEPLLWGVNELDLGVFLNFPCFFEVLPRYRPLVVAASVSQEGPLGLLGLEPMGETGWIVECKYGAGRYILCSAPLDTYTLEEQSEEARRVLSALFANLGVSAR